MTVMRQLYRTTSIRHRANLPAQISSEDEEGEDLSMLDFVTVRLQRGDLLIAGSDGLFDNVSLPSIAKIALDHYETGSAAKGPQAVARLAKTLVTVAAAAARDSDIIWHAVSEHASSPDSIVGGKLDDVAVVVAQVEEWSAASPGGVLGNFDDETVIKSATASQAFASGVTRGVGGAGSAWRPLPSRPFSGARAVTTYPVSMLESTVPLTCPRRSVSSLPLATSAAFSSSRISPAAAATCTASSCSQQRPTRPTTPTGAGVEVEVQGPPRARALEGLHLTLGVSLGPGVLPSSWRVVRELGRGSYATAWELQSTCHGENRAVLKIFDQDPMVRCLFGSRCFDEVEAQFSRESRALLRLHQGPVHEGRHHVIQLLSAAPSVDDSWASSKALVRGRLLRALVQEYAGATMDSFPAAEFRVAQCVAMADQMRKAVAYLRPLGIVHADISLANCALDGSGRARLIDFGNSLVLEEWPARSAAAGHCARLERLRMRYVHHPRFPPAERYSYPLSVARMISDIERPRHINVYSEWCDPDLFPGNLAAAPPEVLRGLLLPGLSDVYSVGVLLWQLLTIEETPFEIDMVADRIRFKGWDNFYSLPLVTRVAFLVDRLAANLRPHLRSELSRSDLQKLGTWFGDALAEAPEDRVRAADAGPLDRQAD
ncbi:unnamed protein product [Prorocentrum cordatum]|nr:unnamed protein product [Polarella glacialis]